MVPVYNICRENSFFRLQFILLSRKDTKFLRISHSKPPIFAQYSFIDPHFHAKYAEKGCERARNKKFFVNLQRN